MPINDYLIVNQTYTGL